MKGLIYFPFFCLLVFTGSTQTINPVWERQDPASGTTIYGAPFVMVDPFHNSVVCNGDYTPGPGTSLLTSKYDAEGNLLWQRKYDTFGSDFMISMALDSVGGIYVGGNTIHNLITGAIPRLTVIKYGQQGDTSWLYGFDGPAVGVTYLTKLWMTEDLHLTVFGQYGDTVQLKGGLFVTQLAPNGQELWRATYIDSLYGLVGLTARKLDDRWAFWGRYYNSVSGYRYHAWQIGEQGEDLGHAWTEVFPGLFNTQFIDRQGNLFIGDSYRYHVIKYGLNGEKKWEYDRPLPPSTVSVPARMYCIESDENSNVFIGGHLYSDLAGYQALNSKLDASGNLEWEHFVEFNGLKEGAPVDMSWINKDLLLVTINIITNLDSNFYELGLSIYSQDGLFSGGVSDLEGKSIFPTSNTIDNNYIYIVGKNSTNFLQEKQFLAKYPLNLLTPTTFPLKITQRLNLWPNPVRDRVWVQLPEHFHANAPVMLTVTDVCNRILKRQGIPDGTHVAEVNLDGLLPGVYFVQIEDGIGKFLTGKITKE
ncbi:MAG: T9SS type A sorting domain-containing protein [Saprospiraceae bacterium]|nr:T9SS type A sorting domain-containing protein [Saprospiraceae bacterium]